MLRPQEVKDLKTSVNGRLDGINRRQQEFDAIPGLVARIDNIEAKLEEVKSELAEIK